MNRIDTTPTSLRMRSRVIRPAEGRVLVSRLEGSAQEADLTLPPNCGGLGRVRHFRRSTSPGWPENPLPIDPAARALGVPRERMARAQVFQNAACAWRCWYCYVPFELLAGAEARAEWLDADGMVALYAAEPDRPSILDLSGGSPDLTPEWILWTIRALRHAGMEESTYLWSDDNLSTDFYFDALSPDERREIAAHRNYGRVCCFKGFDDESFAFNTSAAPGGFATQLERFARYLDAGLDLYAYVTLTGPPLANVASRVDGFVDALASISPNLPLRTVPLRIEPFGPLLARRQHRDVGAAMDTQEAAVAAWRDALSRRYSADQLAGDISAVAL